MLNKRLSVSCQPLTAQEISRIQKGATDLGKALFYAIKHQDYNHASDLVRLGAPIERCYEVEKDEYKTTASLLVTMLCTARIKRGYSYISYKVPEKILDSFIKLGVDLKCHCSNKFEHRCPLFVALQILEVQNEQDIFKEENSIIQKLILNGATIKKHLTPHRTYLQIPYFDIEGVRSYLISKNQLQNVQRSSIQTKLSNYHDNNQSPLAYKHHSQFNQPRYNLKF